MRRFSHNLLLLFTTVICCPSGFSNKKFSHLHSKLQFTENKGQESPDFLYTGETGNGTKIYFQKNKISFVVTRIDVPKENEEEEAKERNEKGYDPLKEKQERLEDSKIFQERIDLEFANANPGVQIIAQEPSTYYTNYYLPQCKNGVTANSYSKLIYKNIYPHIDIIFHQATPFRQPAERVGEGLEYDFILNPGADPNDIKLIYTGNISVLLNDNTLKIKGVVGEIEEYIPETFQIIDGKKVNVKAEYELKKVNSEQRTDNKQRNLESAVSDYSLMANGYELNFQLSPFNSSYPLIIDPIQTYYGGSERDRASSIATDGNDNVIITGWSASPDFPVVSPGGGGYFQSSLNGQINAFIVKLAPNGTPLWATYYGGSKTDAVWSSTADAQSIVVVGTTNSSDLPTYNPIAGAYLQTNYLGLFDTFILKFDQNGNRLWATYYGGTKGDYGVSAAISGSGDIAFTGYTSSDDLMLFNPSGGAYFQTSVSGEDVFIVKFDPNGNRLWATYYGGSNSDRSLSVTTDHTGNVIIAGNTSSTNFKTYDPGGGAYYQTIRPNYDNAFVAKFDPAGALTWSTGYTGTGYWGSFYTGAFSVATDNADNVLFLGYTVAADLPVTPNAFQTSLQGALSATVGNSFIVKFNSSNNRLWATYFNAEDDYEYTGSSIATDQDNNVYIAGSAENDDMPITPCAMQTEKVGIEDFYFAKFDPDGNFICSTYLGYGWNETFSDKLIAFSGNYADLLIDASGFGFPTTSTSFQQNLKGIEDPYIIQLCKDVCNNASSPNFSASQTTICEGDKIDFTSMASSCHQSGTYSWVFQGGTPAVSSDTDPVGIVYNNAGLYSVELVVDGVCGIDSLTKKKYIKVIPKIALTSSPDVTICYPNSVTLSASVSGGAGVHSYLWLPANSTTQTIQVSPSQFTSYTVTASDKNCSGNVSDIVNVYVNPGPTALFVYSPSSPTITDIIKFTDESFNSISGWQWNYGNSVTSDLQDPNYNYADTGLYTVKLIVTDINGCMDSTKINIHINGYYVFYAPNSFSPNGDGLNDVFYVTSKIIDEKEFRLVIFDRWGQKIFESTPLSVGRGGGGGAGWDGSYQGIAALEDVYIWVADTKDYLNNNYHYTGRVTLIR